MSSYFSDFLTPLLKCDEIYERTPSEIKSLLLNRAACHACNKLEKTNAKKYFQFTSEHYTIIDTCGELFTVWYYIFSTYFPMISV